MKKIMSHVILSRADGEGSGRRRSFALASLGLRMTWAAFLFFAVTAHAQVVATTTRGVVVAHDGRIEMFANETPLWSVPGVEHPSKIVVGADRVVVIDSFANSARIAHVQSGSGAVLRTGETPIDGVFIGSDLFLLERDARALERIGEDGARASVTLNADPAFLREANGRLYVYSRLEGTVQEIAPNPLRVIRSVALAPFASDFETDGRAGYLVFPREAKLRTFDLRSMKSTGEIAAGAVPVDMAVTRGRLWIADPAAKRVWTIEGAQSVSAAFMRGFLRGLLGFGLRGPQSSRFPTGIDRVISSAFAYDSSTGTLYRARGEKSDVIAKGIEPAAFALSGRGVAFWQNGRLTSALGPRP